MSRVFPVAAVREAEQSAVSAGTAEYALMDNAGRQAADIINYHFKEALFFCAAVAIMAVMLWSLQLIFINAISVKPWFILLNR